MKLHCRLYTPDDIDGLVALWNSNADWGEINREQWEKVFYHTPFGPSTIVVAEDEGTGEILAQFVFLPVKLGVGGQEVPAFKACAPITSKNVRTDLGLMAFLKMYKFSVRHFTETGAQLLYMMPDPRWARAFQIVPNLQVATFPLWCLPLQTETPLSLPPGYAVETITAADDRMDSLWARAAQWYDCSLVRNQQFFSWKLSHRAYHSFGLSHEGRLVGFAAFLFKKEIKGIALCDVLAEDEHSLRLTLQAACSVAAQFKASLPEADQPWCEKLTILATPLLQKLVAPLGFEKNNYKFSLAVHVLGKGAPKKELSPERWYVSAND